MNQLRVENIDKMMYRSRAGAMTSTEVLVLAALACYQDDSGLVSAVHYKDICDRCCISIKSFYNALKGLSVPVKDTLNPNKDI